MKRKVENQTVKNEAIETKPIKKIKKEAARVKLENLKIQNTTATTNNQNLISPQINVPQNFQRKPIQSYQIDKIFLQSPDHFLNGFLTRSLFTPKRIEMYAEHLCDIFIKSDELFNYDSISYSKTIRSVILNKFLMGP